MIALNDYCFETSANHLRQVRVWILAFPWREPLKSASVLFSFGTQYELSSSPQHKDFQKPEILLFQSNDVLNRKEEMKLNENRFPKTV